MRRSVWRSPASLGLLAGVLAIVIAHACELDGAASAARGDAAKGERLFATLPCVSCHDVTKPWPGGDICPNLGNIATEAARIIRLREYRGKARTAADYIRESILDPDKVVVPGYPAGVMKATLTSTGFYQKISVEGLERVVDYLSGLKGKP